MPRRWALGGDDHALGGGDHSTWLLRVRAMTSRKCYVELEDREGEGVNERSFQGVSRKT